jgi:1,2-diacylglycerol 3-alpha-glucosyltransferase
MTAIIWIDWYSYHVSRFRALTEHDSLRGNVTGIELVGGCGVHQGLKFRSEDREGLPIVSLLPAADWQSAGRFRMARAVWSKLSRLNPSAVFVPGIYTVPGFAAALWARLHGKRSILMSETTESDYQRVRWREIAKTLLTRAMFDSGIAGGHPHARYLLKLGIPAPRLARCYDVVDNQFFDEGTRALRQQPNKRSVLNLPEDYFLYVGRLSPEKNLTTLIDGFAEYCKRGGAWSLVLVGDGAERASLENRCVELGVRESVHFAGLKPTHETVPYYAFAGCFVLPSLREPWGLVVNEAMASHLPVLVSGRCGCAEDLVENGGNGHLFDPRSSSDLADRMLQLSSASAANRNQMGERSWEIIQKYSLRTWADEVARLVGDAA